MTFVTTIGLTLSLIVLGTVWGLIEVWLWKRRLPRLQAVLKELVERYGRPDLTLSAGRWELLVSDDYVHYLDMRKLALVESLPVADIESLEVLEKSTSHIWFHFLKHDGTRSLLLSTEAITRFSDLFTLMIANGKEIRYSRGVA
jgi:tRNA uridine 5-carbamoylmethylation protein Kti12